MKDILEAKIIKEVGEHIIKELEKSIPKRERYLQGNCKKAYEGYSESIKNDIKEIPKFKEWSKKEKQDALELLEAELFHAECIFTYIQVHYYLKPKKE